MDGDGSERAGGCSAIPPCPGPRPGHFHTSRAVLAALFRLLFVVFNLIFLHYNFSPFDILSATRRENRLFLSPL